jgi:thymidylate synthase
MSYIENQHDEAIDVSHNHINVQVLQLIEDLGVAGQTSSPRGLVTKDANLATLDINPLYCAMDFTPRKFNYRYFAGELAWYLRADTSIDFINNFSSFWKNICPDGHANSNYGSLLLTKHPSTIYSKDTDGYPKESVNGLEWAYDCLVKDKNSRQAVAFLNCPYFQYQGNKDFVCTMYVNFWIRKGYLDMKVQMRSNDIFFGLTYDAPWFSAIQQSMFLNLKEIYPDLKLGMYYHCADNIHYYERHFELADKILDSPLQSSIKMKLSHPLFLFKPREDGTHQIYTSPQAVSYMEIINDMVAGSKAFETELPKDQNLWKTVLGSLFEISGELEDNSNIS